MANNGYFYSRRWFDFVWENPSMATASHSALFWWLIEINNRLGWTKEFQITGRECMNGMCCKSYNTYKKCLDDLIVWGFVKLIKKSTNQYQCNIIALSNFDKAQYKALDKALMNHLTKQSESTVQSTDSILKPQTTNHKQRNYAHAQSLSEQMATHNFTGIEDKKETVAKFITFVEKELPDIMKMKEPLTVEQICRILTDHPDKAEITSIFRDMENKSAQIIKKNKSAYKTFKSWSEVRNRRASHV